MKKLICVLLPAVLLLALLAGCGGSAQTAASSGAASAAQTAAASSGAAASQAAASSQTAASSAAAEQTELSFISWRSEDADVLKAMIADFEAKNPDITVNLEITSSDITEYYTVLKSRLTSGEGADVMMVHPGPYLKELADAGSVLELTDADLLGGMDAGILTGGQVDGKQYGLPETYNSFAIYYNKDLFSQLGITAPTDYASLSEACRKSADAGYMPVSAGFGEAWVTEILYEALMCSYANGDDNVLHNLETGDAKLTDSVYQSVFGDVQKMVSDGIFQDSVLGTTYDSSISLFASGKSTMLMDGTWSIGNLKSLNAGLNFGLARIPSISGADVGPVSPGQNICINANGSHIDAAKRFVAYLFSVECEEAYCNGTSQASTVSGTSLSVPEMDMVGELSSGTTATWPDVFVENAQLLSTLDELCARVCDPAADLSAELQTSQTQIDALNAG